MRLPPGFRPPQHLPPPLLDECAALAKLLTTLGDELAQAESEGGWDPTRARRIHDLQRTMLMVEARLRRCPYNSNGVLAVSRASATSPTPEVVTVAQDGATVEIAPGENPAWSPNGKAIVYQLWVGSTYRLMIASADGSSKIGFSGSDAYHEMAPCWSPDGSEVVFESDRSAGWHLWARR
ncbi:MAG TPA: hypothetical protein VM690_03010, partial [Gaiellaceae bacterium]|nr:hypothetical protein [Gaiellaceae bacterium]